MSADFKIGVSPVFKNGETHWPLAIKLGSLGSQALMRQNTVIKNTACTHAAPTKSKALMIMAPPLTGASMTADCKIGRSSVLKNVKFIGPRP